MTDEDKPGTLIVPAKVHGDSGVTAVVADTQDIEAEDIEESEDADVERIEDQERGLPS